MPLLRLTFLLGIIIFITNCSNRQSFQSANSDNESDGWWQCSPKSDREWRCFDGEKVQETVDVIANQLEPVAITDTQPDESVVYEAPEVSEPELEEEVSVLEEEVETADIVAEPLDNTVVESNEPETETESVVVPASTNRVSKGDWIIQLGSFRSETEAVKLSQRITNSEVVQSDVNGVNWFRVIYGAYDSSDAAKRAASELEQQYSITSWVRKY